MKNSKIEWTDSTINPTSGCDGCELYRPDKNGIDENASCYAHDVHLDRLAKSLPALYAPRFDVVRMIPGRCMQAANWGDLRGQVRPGKPWLSGKPRHIFVGDMGDIFSAAVDFEFLKRELIAAIESKNGQRHVWQILTKRPERLAAFSDMLGGLPDNVVAMTSVTNQRTADLRMPALRRVRCKIRGLSIEPLLGPVDLRKACSWGSAFDYSLPGVHWVICGGESGSHARPMHPDWARSLRDQCKAAGVACFFKQWGSKHNEATFDAGYNANYRKGGRLLDGIEHNEFPEAK